MAGIVRLGSIMQLRWHHPYIVLAKVTKVEGADVEVTFFQDDTPEQKFMGKTYSCFGRELWYYFAGLRQDDNGNVTPLTRPGF